MCNNPKRQKLSILQVAGMFPDSDTAESWFIQNRWPNGVECPSCNSNRVGERKGAKRAWRCKDCRKDFSTKTGTLMQGSNLDFRQWAFAIYLLTTHLKGIASTKLASDLNITQKSAWHLAMRIRETYQDNHDKLSGIVEIDEAYFGGKEKNKHKKKRLKAGRGAVGKQAVIGAKQRDGRIIAKPIATANQQTLHGFIKDSVQDKSTVITDEWRGYNNMPDQDHHTVKHSVGEYVNGMAHTNGIESFWSLLKRGYIGTHHHMSHKHLGRYVGEFAGRHNTRKADTISQMSLMAAQMSGKRLKYRDLIA